MKATTSTRKKSRGNSMDRSATVPVFLQKLVKIIESSPSDLVRWADDGHSFMVMDKARLAKEVLPKYYKTSNFSSFVRQLNFYRFNKVVVEKGTDNPTNKWEFYHKSFVRDRPDLLRHIKRKTYQDQESARQIDALQTEVSSMKCTIDTLTSQVATLQNLVSQLTRKRNIGDGDNGRDQKKRKRLCETPPSKVPKFEDIGVFPEFRRSTSMGSIESSKDGRSIETEEDLSRFLDDLGFGGSSASAVMECEPSTNSSLLDSEADAIMLSASKGSAGNCGNQDSSVLDLPDKNLDLPAGFSEEDAQKVVKMWAIIMPQIQSAFMAQFQRGFPTVVAAPSLPMRSTDTAA
eukprot:g3036.t1